MNNAVIPAFNFHFLTPLYDFLCEMVGMGRSFKFKVLERAKLSYSYHEDLLDIGCGTGTLVIAAKQRHPSSRIVGLDPDPGILAIAEKKAAHQNVQPEFIMAGAEKLPFKDNAFSVVVSSLAFHHFPIDIKKGAIDEIRRVLKPNGRFLLADFGPSATLLYFIVKTLHLPERATLRDNIEGKLPIMLKEKGFKINDIGKGPWGVQFLLTTKE